MNTQANKVTWLLCTESLVDTQANQLNVIYCCSPTCPQTPHTCRGSRSSWSGVICLHGPMRYPDIWHRDQWAWLTCISCVMLISDISVARGEGARGAISSTPPPTQANSESCCVHVQYENLLVYIYKPTSMVICTASSKYLSKYQSTNKILKEITVLECENAKIFFKKLAHSHTCTSSHACAREIVLRATP